ncbi:MAG: glycoside hydrolase [Bacteroidales bacterium]|jgi:polygalacturonase|nr:glycoside hydrolase [Bacteroidales bacterium]
MIKILIVNMILLITQQLSAKDYDVRDFGAVGDGIFVNSNIIQHAIDYINAAGGGRLVFYPGTYVTGSFYLKSNVTLHIEQGATLLGSTNPWDYVKDPHVGWKSMIFAVKQDNIGISGKGIINGRGFTTANNMVKYIQKGLFDDPLKLDRPNETNRPENIYFRECNNVVIRDITLKDPASWNQTYDQCKNLLVDNIFVDSKSYWNNDGIDVVDCDGVVIKNSYFDTADDAICFKSHDANAICQNVVVDNCTGRSSANGLKFGTASRGGFRNFKITNLTIYDTFRSAITFAAVDGGLIENIVVDGLRSVNTGNVLFLRIGNRWSSGKTPSLQNVTIKNVYAEVPYAKPDAGYNYEGPVEDNPRNISPASIIGLPNMRIKNITLENIEMVYPGRSDTLYAKVGLTSKELDAIPEMEKSYPEFSQFKELPAWGMYIRHADDIHFKNVTFRALEQDYRPAVVMDDVKGASFRGVSFSEPNAQGKNQIFKYKSSGINIE